MRNKGITLIALVITVIILLILAGVSISIMLGDNGIITKATTVELKYSKTEIEERFEMIVNDKLIEAYADVKESNADISNYYKESLLIPSFIERGYITADTTSNKVSDVVGEMGDLYSRYIINVSNISDKVERYGKGTSVADGDVFTLEVKTDETGKSTGEYDVKYYETPNGEGEVLTTFTLYLSNNS